MLCLILSSLGLPAVSDGDNSGTIFSNLEEHGHGEVEVGTRRVAPAAIVIGKSVIRGAEIGGSD